MPDIKEDKEINLEYHVLRVAAGANRSAFVVEVHNPSSEENRIQVWELYRGLRRIPPPSSDHSAWSSDVQIACDAITAIRDGEWLCLLIGESLEDAITTTLAHPDPPSYLSRNRPVCTLAVANRTVLLASGKEIFRLNVPLPDRLQQPASTDHADKSAAVSAIVGDVASSETPPGVDGGVNGRVDSRVDGTSAQLKWQKILLYEWGVGHPANRNPRYLAAGGVPSDRPTLTGCWSKRRPPVKNECESMAVISDRGILYVGGALADSYLCGVGTNRTSMLEVLGVPPVEQIAVRYEFAAALTADGVVYVIRPSSSTDTLKVRVINGRPFRNVLPMISSEGAEKGDLADAISYQIYDAISAVTRLLPEGPRSDTEQESDIPLSGHGYVHDGRLYLEGHSNSGCCSKVLLPERLHVLTEPVRHTDLTGRGAERVAGVALAAGYLVVLLRNGAVWGVPFHGKSWTPFHTSSIGSAYATTAFAAGGIEKGAGPTLLLVRRFQGKDQLADEALQRRMDERRYRLTVMAHKESAFFGTELSEKGHTLISSGRLLHPVPPTSMGFTFCLPS